MAATRGAGNDGSVQPLGTLGTFGGVFTPSILTILGLVLFLRTGYVVGSVGLARGLLILALATSVSVLTTISLAVVATNLRVRGGGEYFLISRTLGIEFGGAVGVVLYLAISVSVAFYAIGFAEAVVATFGSESEFAAQLVAAALVLSVGLIGYIGADLATRLQYLVMAVLIVAIGSFLIGGIAGFDGSVFQENLGSQTSDVGFWQAFAVFFPAVTGFSQGVAMSGDLRTPSRSITRGTFAAVGLSTLVYAVVLVVLAGAAPAAVLAGETTTIMGDVSLGTWTIVVGVLAATLSSALASALGGPRVLQRLGEDRVLPRLEYFERGTGPTNNPRRALAMSVVIALATVAAGDLNAIAPVISMFFLASYGLINYATYYEIRAGSTSFRPRFRWFDRRASLVGTVACASAIVAINPVAGGIAAVVFGALFTYLRRRNAPDRWTDSSGAHHYTQARRHIHSLTLGPTSPRDWRPCVLAFVPRDPVARRRMVTMASWLEGGSGFTTAVRILEGSGPIWRRRAAEVERDLTAEVRQIAPGTGARALALSDISVGVQALVQSHGIGSIKANMAIFGARDLRSADSQSSYGEMLHSCFRFGANVAVINVHEDAWERFESTPSDQRSIALWWSDDQVGQLITLLAWLAKRHPDWTDTPITAYVPVAHDSGETARVEQLLDDARIRAHVVEVNPSPAAFADALGQATLALAPLRVRQSKAIGPFETPLGMLVESLPLAVLVLAADSPELDVEPDQGRLAELAKASDQAAKATRWVAELDREASRLLVAAEVLRLDIARADRSDDGTVDELRAELAAADEAAAAAYRRFIDAKTRSAAIQARIEQLDPSAAHTEADPRIWRSSSRRP